MNVVVASRLLILLASWPVAQAFQLQNNNHHHHVVSHPHHLDQPPPTPPSSLDNNKVLLKTTTKKKKKNLLSSTSTQTAATQINRTVNRNTKNRQNHSKCSLEKPHSTLLDITTTTSSSSHHHHDDNNEYKKSIQRSLRQLGITIASTFLIVTQARVKVANAAAAAAAAATPLLVTHPTGIGSTAITPLLSTAYYFPHGGLTIAPFQGLPPAMGEIVLSFAYVILALGVSHTLASWAEGGHVKLLKLMAWQNLADDDTTQQQLVAALANDDTATSKSRNNNKNKKGGMNIIQGLFSRYTYMIQLITSEIRKAYRIGQYNDKNKSLVTTTSTTSNISSPSSSSKMLSRYASNLNSSFQEVYINKDDDDDDDDDGSTMNWKEYSKLLLQKKKKKKKTTSSSTSRFNRVLKNGGGVVYNKFAIMFERVATSDSEAEATKKATELFQQKQFEQHHHHVHVPRSPFEESSYLDSLTTFGPGEGGSSLHKKEPIKGYLDTLSDVTKKSTWDVYKDQVENAKKEMTTHDDEVDYLKEELVHVQSLLQDEQAMYQTSNQALNLAVEAQNEELKHARAAAATTTTTTTTKDTEGQQHSTTDELKEFDIKAKEYDEAIKESKKAEEVKNNGSASTTAPHEWIF